MAHVRTQYYVRTQWDFPIGCVTIDTDFCEMAKLKQCILLHLISGSDTGAYFSLFGDAWILICLFFKVECIYGTLTAKDLRSFWKLFSRLKFVLYLSATVIYTGCLQMSRSQDLFTFYFVGSYMQNGFKYWIYFWREGRTVKRSNVSVLQQNKSVLVFIGCIVHWLKYL